VVVDGRPLGSTPKVGLAVSAGSHTVTFIHPEYGKRAITVTVKDRETKTVAVRFP
jgi:serine/threonine-protein kinase